MTLPLTLCVQCVAHITPHPSCRRTAEQLAEESECTLDHPLAAKFRQFVLNGLWEEVSTHIRTGCPYIQYDRHAAFQIWSAHLVCCVLAAPVSDNQC